LKIIAAIEDPPVIAQILAHLGLPARAPPRAPVRLPELIQAARSKSATTVLRPRPTTRLGPRLREPFTLRRSDATLGPR